jgi:hypothetical protein
MFALFLPLALMGCLSLHAGYFGDAIDGRDVERVIDKRLTPTMRSFSPKLRFEPSTCPDRIDVSRGRVVHCSLMIGATRIPVRVAYSGPPQDFKVSFEGTVFDMGGVETFVRELLRTSYGVRASVRCGTPRVRLLSAGVDLTCRLLGSRKLSLFRIKTLANGKLWFETPRGLQEAKWMRDGLQKHKEGKPTLVDGSAIAAWIDSDITSSSAAMSIQRIPGHPICPARLDLTGKRHAHCHLAFRGRTLRYDVSIDDRAGLREGPLDAVIDGGKVQREAERDINERLAEVGLASDAAVACTKSVIVVPIHGKFYCDLTIAGQWRRLLVEVGESGAVRWRVADSGR